jgi:hypothetical protein
MGLASGLIHTSDNQVEYFKFTADRKWVTLLQKTDI